MCSFSGGVTRALTGIVPVERAVAKLPDPVAAVATGGMSKPVAQLMAKRGDDGAAPVSALATGAADPAKKQTESLIK